MSNNEAKFLLNAYRANGADATDPAFGPALAQAKADPALGTWFAREQVHSAAMAAKLREIAPPVGLRDAILAGGRATASAPRGSRRLNLGQWMALAASIVLLAGAALTLRPQRSLGASALTAFAFDDLRHGHHGAHGGVEKALQARLGQTSTPLTSGIPVTYDELEKSGCRTLTIAGREVVEICFARNGAEFHCYVARAGDFTGETSAAGPRFSQDGALAAADWVTGAIRYVVVTNAGAEALKRLL